MKAIFLNIAVNKANTAAEQRQALLALRDTVAAYETADATFAESINACKARGDAPTQLAPAKQKQLAVLDQDRAALDDDMAIAAAGEPE